MTRDYVPVGHLVPGFAYPVCGILENASQAGFLAQSRDLLSAEVVATDPARSLCELTAQGAYTWDQAARAIDEASWPSPMVRLYLPAERQAFADALALTAVYPPARVTPADVPDAVRQARQGAEAWGAWSPKARAAVLIRAAERMRAQRLALGALIVREGRELKPAEQTPAIGAALAELLHAAGVPHEPLVFVPGDGQLGAASVASNQVDVVAFAGSGEVGRQIFYTSTQVATRRLRRVIAETGSKNPIVVSPSADLDSAIEGILRSAFGNAGQKGSACSRVKEGLAFQETAARASVPQVEAARCHILRGTDREALASISAVDFVAGSDAANGAPPDLPEAFVRRFVRPRPIAKNTLRPGALISTGGIWE